MYKAFFITPKHTNLMLEIKFINNKNKPIKVAVGLYNSKKPICSDEELCEEEQYMYRKREHGYEVPTLEDDHEYSYIYILYEDNTVVLSNFRPIRSRSPPSRLSSASISSASLTALLTALISFIFRSLIFCNLL